MTKILILAPQEIADRVAEIVENNEILKHKMVVIPSSTETKIMNITLNFSLNEFASKDGASFPLEIIDNIKLLAANLQVIRDEIKRPMSITSGYRSPAHNRKIGGATNSYHVRGMAADLKASGLTPKQLFDIIERLQREGKIAKGGLKAYNTFTHYDIRGTNARW